MGLKAFPSLVNTVIITELLRSSAKYIKVVKMAELFSPLVPVRFYGVDTGIYIICALIGLMISYQAYKLYQISGKKQHMYLLTAFAILGVGFLTLTLTTGYTYFRYFVQGEIYQFDPLFGIDDVGFWVYFGASFIGYALLAAMYTGEQAKPLIVPAIFVTANYFSYVNIILFFLIAFVAFRAATTHFSNKTKGSGRVMLSFSLVTLYHALLPFAAFSKVLYVAAHISLILGFGMLWRMLSKKE